MERRDISGVWWALLSLEKITLTPPRPSPHLPKHLTTNPRPTTAFQTMTVFSPAGVRSSSGRLVYQSEEDVDQLAMAVGQAYREHGVGGGKNVDEAVVVVLGEYARLRALAGL